MVLTHVEVFETLDAWVIERYQLLDQGHVYFALFDVKYLLVDNFKVHVKESVAVARGLYAYQASLTAVRALQE